MCRILQTVAVALGILLLAGCGRAETLVILISLDGATPAQLARNALPTLDRLAREGASARSMRPVFPSNTFPNHASLVTGVRPERHGIVNNVFLDPERGRFSYDNDPSWFEVEPLWSLVGRQGVPSAAYHWLGSQGRWRDGVEPIHWMSFDPRVPVTLKVDRILAWLDETPAPRLVTTWFPGADRTGHRHGPDAPEVDAALAEQDAALGRLVAGLEARGRIESTALLIVSDHGMAKVTRRVDLAAALDEAGIDARVMGGGGFSLVALDEGEDVRAAVAVARGLGLEAHPRTQAPADWPVGNVRFADVVVMAPVGTGIVRGGLAGRLSGRAGLEGSHGYTPDAPEMGAVFLAWGGLIARDKKLGPVRTLDVAPTVLDLLGLPVPSWMEGRPIEGIRRGGDS